MLMWLTMLEIVLASGILGAIWVTFKKHHNSHDRIERSLRFQLRREMKQIYLDCKEVGYVSIEDEEDFYEIWDLYKEMNGNSYAERQKCKFDNLPRQGDLS